MKYNAEIISTLFQRFISHVTTALVRHSRVYFVLTIMLYTLMKLYICVDVISTQIDITADNGDCDALSH